MWAFTIGVTVLVSIICFWFYWCTRDLPKVWTFGKIMSSSCPGGTVYEGHSLHQVDATPWWSLAECTNWACWRCDGEWRCAEAEDRKLDRMRDFWHL